MPESDATHIVKTTVIEDGPNGACVELSIANATSLEEATESITISVRIAPDKSRRPPYLIDYQREALHRAVELIREHSRPLDQLLNH